MSQKLRLGMETRTTRVSVVDDDNFVVAEFPSREKAERFCQRDNSFDALLDACKAMYEALAILEGYDDIGLQARDTIAKAEGKV